jgi:hypothetical protein
MGSFLDKNQIAERVKGLIGDASVRQIAMDADIDPSQFNKIVKADLTITPNILDKLVSKISYYFEMSKYLDKIIIDNCQYF